MAYGSPFSFSGLTTWVKRLIVANLAIFVVTWLAGRFGVDLFAFLAFVPSQALREPWTVLTYMFVHAGFFHVLFNMLALFFFGPPLEERWGSREFIKYYLICGLGGAAFSFLFAFHSPVVGASAAVYGVMLAFAMNWPNSPIYIWGIFPIAAKWLVLIFVALSLFSGFNGTADGVAHFAHLGGFAAGFLYLKLDRLRSGAAARLKKLRPKPRLTVVPGTGTAPPPKPARRAQTGEEERLLDDVDRILDKIGRTGMSSLTPEEKRLLDEVSRRYRKN
ncbi:MAG TPA: rhomboid family intramembrane serine protease [Longimicrobiales bacterium]|nr:rhomboid family intramembrane serine protease [Longimicrobiales bacterium]